MRMLPDDEVIQRLVLAGVLTLADAEAMRARPPIQRVIVDELLQTLAASALGEANPGRFGFLVEQYKPVVSADPSWREELPPAIADGLSWATAQYKKSTKPASYEAKVRAQLVPDAASEHQRGLIIAVRTLASRLADGFMHPFLALERAVDLSYAVDPGDEQLAAGAFVVQAVARRDAWTRDAEGRAGLERQVVEELAPLAW